MISSLYLHSKSANEALRIGVLVDSFLLPAAFRQVLSDILSSDYARLKLVVVHKQRASPQKTVTKKLIEGLAHLGSAEFRRHFLYTIYQKLDQRFARQPDPFEIVDCTDILTALPRLDVLPDENQTVDFPPEVLKSMKCYDLDVLLAFGLVPPRGDVLKSARYGIWSYHYGDTDFYRGGPAMFWEIVEASTCSGVILEVLKEGRDPGQVLCKSIFATEGGLSCRHNAFMPVWGSTHFIIRKLHELHERGWQYLKQTSLPPAPYRGRVATYRSPSNQQLIQWLAPKLASRIVRRLNPLRKDNLYYHWRIYVANTPCSRLLQPSGEIQYKSLPSPAGHMYADPFLFQRNGQMWLFFEDYSYTERRGVIRCCPIQSDLAVGPVFTCLDLPYHLSYPAVFCYEGETFVIPESSSNKDVELWRATEFPFKWKLEKILFRGLLVDTTPFLHNGYWYFFTTIAEPLGNAVFGALFWADELTGDWTLHPSSPICSDVRYARQGGPLQEIDGHLLRPVQDCSERYGRRINVMEILELSPDAYRENSLRSLEPDWDKGLEGAHTYGYCNGIEVLDAVKFLDRDGIKRSTKK